MATKVGQIGPPPKDLSHKRKSQNPKQRVKDLIKHFNNISKPPKSPLGFLCNEFTSILTEIEQYENFKDLINNLIIIKKAIRKKYRLHPNLYSILYGCEKLLAENQKLLKLLQNYFSKKG